MYQKQNSDRLKTALKKEDETQAPDNAPLAEESASKVITTDEELESFMIVKSILRQRIAINRITYRDAQSYFAILLDDNNRKTICRMYLNGNKKSIATIDDQKKEVKFELNSLDDIFRHSDELLRVVETLEKSKEVIS